ncbi:hypothetical protein PIB30_062008 [Stylosanthes scabra]|uniref:Uncharacterized protein n=1 Tax=Stylosanthes scabra TaxID=79078 RepID=A0ABU6QLQ5_9FABA|nr:hypothetical protein [Stylosanthes scabra]
MHECLEEVKEENTYQEAEDVDQEVEHKDKEQKGVESVHFASSEATPPMLPSELHFKWVNPYDMSYLYSHKLRGSGSHSALEKEIHPFSMEWSSCRFGSLMIVGLKDRVIYALDVSRSPDSMKRRKDTIDSLCHTMGSIFLLGRNIMNFGRIIPDPQNFGLPVYPQGIPGDLNRYFS